MDTLTTPQMVECFHLAFLAVLPREFDPVGFVLKGGANLRFFFNSERYSEDIDLDVVRLKEWQVRDKVNRTLESRALGLMLRTSGLSVDGFTMSKQTGTTQRWKVAVKSRDRGEPVRTKIEFSHRELDPRRAIDPVPEPAIARYGMRPPLIGHYRIGAATEQKIRALAGRSETQARDVFDLDLLLRRGDDPDRFSDPEMLNRARDRALELPYEAYRDQVIPFIEPELAELRDDPGSWESMQAFVAGWLEAAHGAG